MNPFSHLASMAFGALMGALLMGMIMADDNAKMAGAIIEMSTIMREDMVMLPVTKAERKK